MLPRKRPRLEASEAKSIPDCYRRLVCNLMLSVVLAFAALPFLSIGFAAAQISPGPLSRAHQPLDSPTQCTSCHKLGGRKAAFKCLECHTEIGQRLASHRGLHAFYGIKAELNQECTRCHSEHNGQEFALIKWDLRKFDHKQTGYALEGKHIGLSCKGCHSPEHIASAERHLIKVRDLGRTFLGVPSTCVPCHQDPHEGRLGPNCLQCHDNNGWKSVTQQFDHSKTRYPLTGLHAGVACQRCHTPGPDNKPRYLGLPFGKCSDCHIDPHHQSFAQQSCQSCHNTGGWKRVSTVALNQNFDHAKTKYPLVGKHQQVDCLACHRNGDFKQPLTFQKCMDCHQDEHRGQFAKRTGGPECSACHNLEGFKPSTFGLKEHASTAYPLQGKHGSLQCAQCHTPRGKETLYAIKFERCLDCHKDEHQAQFAAAPYLNRCEQCHTLDGFRPSTFGLTRHKQSRFILTGAHLAVTCQDCHKTGRPSSPQIRSAVLYHFQDVSCTTCHEDPHRGQFRERMERTNNGKALGCEVCHSTKSWKELSRFDHSQTSFALVGAHRAVACIDCHKPPNLETKLINVDFRSAPKQCEECHADVHDAQFARARSITGCADCHNSTRWKPSLFDHDKQTTFSLQGAHRNVGCAECHKLTRLINGKSVLFYKPTPKECVTCHGSNVPVAKPGKQ
jgi:hypothetical protein